MTNLTLNIAGIKLHTKNKNIIEFMPDFKDFRIQSKGLEKNIWRIESSVLYKVDRAVKSDLRAVKNKIGSMQERFRSTDIKSSDWKEKEANLARFQLENPSCLDRATFYFNDPVEINLRRRRIKRLYVEGNGSKRIKIIDSRFVTFAYSQILASCGGMLLHCACVVRKGRAYLFFAKPGGGKSTVAKLSRKYTVLGDDIVAVRKNKNRFIAFSTPWRQSKLVKPHPKISAPVKAVFFLHKSKDIRLQPLADHEALVRFLSRCIHFFLYTEIPLAKKIFFTAADFFKNIPAYDMYFRKDKNFWPILDKVIK